MPHDQSSATHNSLSERQRPKARATNRRRGRWLGKGNSLPDLVRCLQRLSAPAGAEASLSSPLVVAGSSSPQWFRNRLGKFTFTAVVAGGVAIRAHRELKARRLHAVRPRASPAAHRTLPSRPAPPDAGPSPNFPVVPGYPGLQTERKTLSLHR